MSRTVIRGKRNCILGLALAKAAAAAKRYPVGVYFYTAVAFIDLSVSFYNHPWDASIPALLVHLSVYRSCSTVYRSRSTNIRLLRHCWCMYRSISLGLQSSKGCVYFCTAGASIGLLVLVYNDPRDASIGGTLVHVWVYWSRSTIIHGMRLFLHCWCINRFIGLSLQSSKGCVYYGIVGTGTGLLVLVYNHPRDASR